jgi:hypothetical protein
MDAHADLAVIRRLMEETRREVTDRGAHLLIWGALSACGLLLTWLAATGVLALDPTVAWLVILGVGWALSLGVGYRAGRRARTVTLGRRMLSAVWLVIAVTLTLVALAGMFGEAVSVQALPGLLSAIIAAPLLLTALLTRERWLGWVAGGWWVGGALMLFVPGLYTLPVMAAMAVLLMLIPGGVLWARSRAAPSPTSPVVEAG